MNGTSRVDRILALCAIVTAISAVGIAVYEARITREHQKISVWPFVSQYNSHLQGQSYTRNVSNMGIGPALIGSFVVRVDGRPVRTWPEVISAVTDGATADNVYTTIGEGSVVLPGQTIPILEIPAGPIATRFWEGMQGERVEMSICYCSLYGDCWVSEKGQSEPQPVRVCRVAEEAAFAQ